MKSGPGAARTILLFHIIVLGPLNSLVWYVPSLRYTRGLGWRIHCGVEVTKSSTNKQNIITNARTLEFLSMLGRLALLKEWQKDKGEQDESEEEEDEKKRSRVRKRRRVVRKKRGRVKKIVTILVTVPPPTQRGYRCRVFQTWLCILLG